MSDEERTSLETILRRRAHDESPIEVLNIDKEENVITKGNNYLSNIERWMVRVKLGSGKQKVLSYIVKKEHATEHMSKLSRDLGVFMREITMYRDILPMMEQLLQEIGDTDEVPWGKCVTVKLYNQLILEDLKAQGYKMMDRKNQLGLDSATLVLRQLGKYHALSRILLKRGQLPAPLFANHCWYSNLELMKTMMNENARRAQVLIEKWGEEWVDALNRFKNMTPDFTTTYLKALSVEPDEFAVLIHGDCWTTNMLFRYEQDLERPFAVKFIDFQIPYVTSPARDLIYFLMTSVRFDIRVQQIDSLLDVYCDSLSFYLKRLGYDGNIPTKDDVKEMIRKRTILEFGDSFMLLPVVLGDTQDAPALEDSFKKELEASLKGEKSPEVWNVLDSIGEPVENAIKHALKKAMSHGLF